MKPSEGRYSRSVNESTATDQKKLSLSGKNRSAIDELRVSFSEKVRLNSRAATSSEGDVWVLVWELVAINIAILGILFAAPSRTSTGQNRSELKPTQLYVLDVCEEENPSKLTSLQRHIFEVLVKQPVPEFDLSELHALEVFKKNPSKLTSVQRGIIKSLMNRCSLFYS